MKMWKKISVLFFVVALSFGLASINTTTVKAAEQKGSYYYEQLTEVQKEIYDALEDEYIGGDGLFDVASTSSDLVINISESWGNGIEDVVRQNGVVNKTVGIFLRENQQLGPIFTGSYSYTWKSTSSNTSKITLCLETSGLVVEEILAYNAGITEAVETITDSLSDDASVYEKVRAIHDWICNRVDYGGGPTSYAVFGEVEDRRVVCAGYAAAFQILCHQMDIDCVYISGSAKYAGEGHAWNKVKMPDGNWYAVDVTWDDGSTIEYDYFLCGKKSPDLEELTFEEEHIEYSTEFGCDVPETAEYGYNGYLDFGDVTFSYTDGTFIISGNGTIPEFVNEDHAPWYPYKDEITSLVVGNGISGFSSGCFSELDKLESITIPYVGLSKDATGEEASFYQLFGSHYYYIPASLTNVVVTDDDNLEKEAFWYCTSLQTVILNEGIEEISEYCFYGCRALTKIEIPGSVTCIERYAFGYCTSLQTVILNEGIEEISE